MKKHYLTLGLFLLSDIICAIISLVLAFLVFGMPIISDKLSLVNFSYLAFPLILVVISYIFKIYNILWRYSHYFEFLRVLFVTLVSILVLFVVQMSVFSSVFSLPVFIMIFFFTNIFIIAQRLIFNYFSSHIFDSKDIDSDIKGNVMLIGAGSAGQMIISEFTHKQEFRGCRIKCVIDDDVYKTDKYISGIKIIGGRDKIIEVAKKYDISLIIFAIPNCDAKNKSEILDICQQTDCELRVVPSVCKMYNLSELAPTIRKVQIEDLLGREPIDIYLGDKLNYVKDKVVLVTGGGGTIGSELCRQIAAHSPKQLIIFDVYENTAYEIQNELKHDFKELNLVTLIGSVRDSKRLDSVFKKHRPDLVFHAAAHKHVPLMEDSPNETIKNNVFGTLKTAQCADKYGAEKFVLISTDKAVNPTNIMGASKRICEMIVQSFDKRSKTDFVAVRFGNVLGSNGSVIPLFEKQIKQGGPVTVTDPNIIRYFMTIPEAVSLVLQAGANAHGGEIFVLDMGEPVKILSLAENLIKLSGFTPYKDIKIEFTGLRPGEKLYEELLMAEEGLTATENELIHIGKPIEFDDKVLFEALEKMRNDMYDDDTDIRNIVKEIVPTYIIKN